MARRHELIPGGGHTYSKCDSRWPANAPTLVRGKGGTVVDAAGRRYVDWSMGINNVLIGHAEGAIDDAVVAAIRNGQNFGRPTELEERAAEAVISLFPHMDCIKFTKNGSDANNAAIRLARAVTGRQHIAFDGTAPFFSTGDWWCSHQAKWAGTLDAERAFSHPFTFNDVDSLVRVFEDRPIACVIMELARAVAPTPEFLQALTVLCHKHGTLLIVDEVVTAFRYRAEGLAPIYGLRPDLLTIGKGLGNGHAVSALLGQRRWMQRGAEDRDVFLLSTTHGAEQGGLAAAIAVTEFYRTHDVPAALAWQGRELRRLVANLAEEFFVPVAIETAFNVRPVLRVPEAHRRDFHATLIDAGVLWPIFWCCPCYQRTAEEIEATAYALRVACQRLAEAVERRA